MSVLCTLLTPLRIYRSVQVFDHIRHILRRLFYIHCIGRHKSGFLTKMKEILNSETVGRIRIPMPFIRRSFRTVSNHLLKTVFRCIDHGAAIAEKA